MKAISLFSGAGGMDLGFRNAGFDIIAAFDNHAATVDTYNKNLGGASILDLSCCNFAKISESLGTQKYSPDIIIGGPPCQGFTSAGTRFWDDPRNKLISNYVDALKQFSPRWFVMENVEGILTTAEGEYLYETVKRMIELGYSIYIRKIYMQEYSIPQRRKRVIIIGNREGKAYKFPEPTTPASGQIYRRASVTLRNAIFDLQDVTDESIDQVPSEETGIKLERIVKLKQGQSMKDLPPELQHASFKRRSHRRVIDGIPSEKRGGAPSGLKRLVYDEPCLTITSASPCEFVHPEKNRMLTIRECARVQTFPDSFVFTGKRNERILQIGNAVPPVFAELIANSILHADESPSHTVQASLVEYVLTKAEARSPALVRTEKKLETLLTNSQQTLF
ncbi:MAG: DNA cytosine methyltransferase [Actinomycetaceae bacterium]|nr:DNA cytosine methyltransferase [Actinomycetaceae bacterium]